MIRFRLSEIMGERKISNLSEIARRAGVSRLTIKALYDEEAQGIKWSTLNGLCRALNCQPGELLEYIPDSD